MESIHIYEFILWNNCSSNCSFCWQKHLLSNLCTKQQLDSIKLVNTYLRALLDKKSPIFDILLIGGEIFDISNSELKSAFLNLVSYICDCIKTNNVRFLYINSNLLYTNLDFLLLFFNIVHTNKLEDHIKFTTSYDIAGRFNTASKKMFFDNLLFLTTTYPEFNITINSILTKQLCNFVLTNKTSLILEFYAKYGLKLRYIPYVNTNVELCPTKEQVMSTILYESSFNDTYITTELLEYTATQIKTVLYFNGSNFECRNDDILSCLHGRNFSTYSTNNTCYICDLAELNTIV